MSELTLTLLRLGYLALLWALVLSVAGVIRRDIFGTRVTRRATAQPAGGSAARAGAPAAASAAPARPRAAPTASRIVVTGGSLLGTTLTLGQAAVLIGRAPECTLVLEDDFASQRHARIYPDEVGWMVEDLGSTNGTFVGKTRIEAPTRIGPSSQVRIGRTVLELRK